MLPAKTQKIESKPWSLCCYGDHEPSRIYGPSSERRASCEIVAHQAPFRSASLPHGHSSVPSTTPSQIETKVLSKDEPHMDENDTWNQADRIKKSFALSEITAGSSTNRTLGLRDLHSWIQWEPSKQADQKSEPLLQPWRCEHGLSRWSGELLPS